MGAIPHFLFHQIPVFHYPLCLLVFFVCLHGIYPLSFVLSRRLLQLYVDRPHPCTGPLPTPFGWQVTWRCPWFQSTTLTYFNGFKRWRCWASKFSTITLLPAAPAYVALLLSVLQASTSPSPVQSALYSIRWAHDVAGLESPSSHNLPQKDLEPARRRLSHQTSKKLPMTREIFTQVFPKPW